MLVVGDGGRCPQRVEIGGGGERLLLMLRQLCYIE